MTEAEWLTCAEPEPMLEFLRGKASDRKLRLFAVACCRRILHLLTDVRSVHAVETIEQNADGKASMARLQAAGAEAEAAFHSVGEQVLATVLEADLARGVVGNPQGLRGLVDEQTEREAYHRLDRDSTFLATSAVWTASAPELRDHRESHYITSAICTANTTSAASNDHRWEASCQAALIRDIFGNPFRPVTIDPSWLTWHFGTIPKLAQMIYDERRFEDMPILADALEEAGCRSGDILAHCRGSGPHVRGCWVVDALLGKE